MKTYLVGGAVRDKQLQLPVYDRDWLVTGATVDDMLKQGFEQVGKDFPVFLHPKSHEEYALARTERKIATGYTGFSCFSDAHVTLEEDLLRRDLTINAMVEDDNGNIIDPYNGLSDIKNKCLRHVSAAFSEDPLRILRVARFAARFAHLGFSIADETMALMSTMSNKEELNSIAAERIWVETEKALKTEHCDVYFQVLKDCGALTILFPEIEALFGVPQTEIHHPEIDTGIHTLMVLQQATLLSSDIAVRFAALTHDLGKAITPADEWPRHIQHEKRGIKLVKQLCQRLRIPNDIRDLAVLVCEYHLHSHKAFELKAKTVQKLFKSLDLYRKPERLPLFLLACEADARGRKGFEQRDYPQRSYLTEAFEAVKNLQVKDINIEGLKGPEIGQALSQARISIINKLRKQHQLEQAEND
ncbi:MAG: multifunctional CCA addition/repair protein [Pseudomonadales bacterium]|nr:multifunctional CCA addition/repair protein [Pseudomonadales bacterium]